MSTLNLGKIGIVNKGIWSAGTYKKLELAKIGQITYICDAESTTSEPPHADWSIFVEDGLNGTGFYVKIPTIDIPTTGATDTDVAIQITGSTYETYETFAGTHTSSLAEFSETSDFAIVIQSTDGLETITASGLSASTTYYARIKYISGTFSSEFSDSIVFTTKAAGIETPTIADDLTDAGKNPTFTTTAYATFGGLSETQTKLTVIVYKTADDSIIETIENTATDATTATMTVDLEVSTGYYAKAFYTGSGGTLSSLSLARTFTTKDAFNDVIGLAGGQGFGVGYSSNDVSPLGLTELTGTTDPTHENYGNYFHTPTGSTVVCVLKHFMRVGDASSPQFATYGANALDVVGTETFATEAEAITGGYWMPRCFIDGGLEKDEVFVDKYLNSKFDGTVPMSKFGEVPISLTTSATYTPSSTMTGCTGILADAVVLGRARGAGWSNMSTFVFGMLANLSVAHAQASTSSTHNAWYDVTDTTNFPKGCNSSLADVNDASVTYTTAGDGDANKPLAGATANFNKTTHNGQASGIADLNGSLYEVPMGITNYGTSATASTAIANDDIFVLKESVKLTDLTGGWDGTNDVWGNTTHMNSLYESVTSPHALGSTTGTVYWGNGANAVISDNPSLSGFIPKDNTSTDATGTNQFGNDQMYRYNKQNMAARCGGLWSSAAAAGVFYRSFDSNRSYGTSTYGFRSVAYLS